MNLSSRLQPAGARPRQRTADVALPQTFRYATPGNRCGLPVLLLFGGFALGGGVWLVFDRFPRAAAEMWTINPLLALALLALTLPLFLGLPTLFLALFAGLARDTFRRWDERIEATEAGIAFYRGDGGVYVPWREVTGLRIAEQSAGLALPRAYVVATRRGEFEFTQTIVPFPLLLRLIAERAPARTVPGWSCRSDTLGGDRERWTGPSPGAGQRVYHYRTRTNRALLWLGMTFSVLSAVLPILATAGWLPHREPPLHPANAALFTLPAAWLLWRFRKASIRTDDRGIYQDDLFGVRAIPWSEVRAYHAAWGEQGTWFGNVIGSRTRIRFRTTIADVEELMAEIARRAVNAQGTWKRPCLSSRLE